MEWMQDLRLCQDNVPYSQHARGAQRFSVLMTSQLGHSRILGTQSLGMD